MIESLKDTRREAQEVDTEHSHRREAYEKVSNDLVDLCTLHMSRLCYCSAASRY